jgi:hypothetical protein
MSHLAAALLLVMPPPRAWSCMVNLLDAHHFHDFYSMDLSAISMHSDVFGELLQQFMPEVCSCEGVVMDALNQLGFSCCVDAKSLCRGHVTLMLCRWRENFFSRDWIVEYLYWSA